MYNPRMGEEITWADANGKTGTGLVERISPKTVTIPVDDYGTVMRVPPHLIVAPGTSIADHVAALKAELTTLDVKLHDTVRFNDRSRFRGNVGTIEKINTRTVKVRIPDYNGRPAMVTVDKPLVTKVG